MNKLKIILIVFVASVLMSSCITAKKCAERYPPQLVTKDSIVVKDTIIFKNIPVIIKGDSIIIHDSVPCPGVQFHKEVETKSGLKAKVDFNNGKLNVECKYDSLVAVITHQAQQIRTLERYKQETKTSQLPPVVKIKYKVPKWCWVLLIINVLVLGFRYRVRIMSFIKKLSV